jgi:Protein of unknown function (DUF3828)
MNRRVLLLSAAALAACSRESGKTQPAPAAAAPDPAETIRPLYTPYMSDGAEFPAFRDQAPWSADLWARLEAMNARSQAINEPILDFDPLTGAQDYRLSALTVRTESVAANSRAVVRAHFINLGRDAAVIYDLIWERGGWRVDNIHGADWDLRQIAAEGGAP